MAAQLVSLLRSLEAFQLLLVLKILFRQFSTLLLVVAEPQLERVEPLLPQQVQAIPL
jgi:hypothetical protein